MRFDVKVRDIFYIDDRKVVFFKGRKQPSIIKNGEKKELPPWSTWDVVFTFYLVKENKIKRIREYKLTKTASLQVVTIENYPECIERPFVFKLVRYNVS